MSVHICQPDHTSHCQGGDRVTTTEDLIDWINNSVFAEYGKYPEKLELDCDPLTNEPRSPKPITAYLDGTAVATIELNQTLGFFSVVCAPNIHIPSDDPSGIYRTLALTAQVSARMVHGNDTWRHGGECVLPWFFHAQYGYIMSEFKYGGSSCWLTDTDSLARNIRYHESGAYCEPLPFAVHATTCGVTGLAPSLSRDLMAALVGEVPPDTVLWRTLDGMQLTAGELVIHIQNGSDIGYQYASDLLRISRDFLGRHARRESIRAFINRGITDGR